MNNKLIRVLVAALLSSAVYAAPSSKELKEKQSEKQGQLDSLTEKKESVDSEITSYIEQIAEVKKSQKKVESQLRAAEAQVDEQYADMKDRIRFMYEDGGVSLLNIMFESKDMGDFVNKAYFIICLIFIELLCDRIVFIDVIHLYHVMDKSSCH